MAEEKVIIELDIKTDKAIADTVALKEKVASMKKELKELKDVGDENTEAYVLLNATMKATEKQLRNNEAQLQANATLQKEEIGTIERLEAANAELRAEKRKLNLETEEGQKRMQEINATMDANNQLLKESGNQAQKQAANIGNYPQQIEVLNTSMGKIPTSAGGIVDGFKSMGKAALAFVMNPIGLTIAAIVGSLILLKKSLSGTEEGQNKMNKITGMLSGALSALMNVIRPLAMFIADYVIVYFETLGKVADKALGIVSKGLAILGFEKAAAAVDGFGTSVKNTMQATKELTEAEAELQKVVRESERIKLEGQKAAEKQRQIRDDESKSMKERVAANEQLNAILQQQLKDETAIANQSLKVAELRIKAEGESTEALNQRAEALTLISDIQERITGQESEYLANVNSLRKDQIAMDKEFADAKAKKLDDEKKAKEEADKAEIERQKKIVDEKLKLLDLELREYAIKNQSKLEGEELLTQKLVDEENKRQSDLQAIEAQSLEVQKKAGLISEQEYAVAKLELDAVYNEQKIALQSQYAEQEKQRKLTEAQYQFELDQQILEQSLMGAFDAETKWVEEDRKRELEFADKTILTEDGKRKAIEKINAKYDKADKAIKVAKFQAELALAGGFANNIAEIAGKNSKVGKAAAAVATTISTIQGGVAAFTGMTTAIPGPVGIGLGLAASTAALVSGYKSVKEILSTNSGLPGDGSPSASLGQASSPSVSVATALPTSVNPSLGQGIISRQVDDTGNIAMKSAFSDALKENPLRPVLVTDDVTLSQTQANDRNKASTI